MLPGVGRFAEDSKLQRILKVQKLEVEKAFSEHFFSA